MSDLIDRQDAIDALRDEFKRIPTTAIRAKTVIEQLPSLQPEPSQVARDIATVIENEQDMRVLLQPEPQWIPCKNMLPEEAGLYIVSGKGKVWVCEFAFIGNMSGGWIDLVTNPVITAWMPMPTAYRDEERENDKRRT